MALIPKQSYPDNTDSTDANYPQGKARNVISPGDGTGTPLEQGWLNDLWGFLQALLNAASITPSGTADNISASQYLQSLQTIFAAIGDSRFPTTDQKAALDAANSPSAGNAIATIADLSTTFKLQGYWDASTNTPDLAGATPEVNHFWIVSVAGSTNLNGITDWGVGDWAVYSASGWIKVDNTSALTPDQIAAMNAANSPSASNPVATMDDIPAGVNTGFDYNKMAMFEDQQSAGVNGGSSSGGSWNTRVLNTSRVNSIGATLSANQITLPAGTYFFEATAPACKSTSAGTQHHKLRLKNITDDNTMIVGTSEAVGAGVSETISTKAHLSGPFTISEEKTIELQHFTSMSVGTYGLGAATGSSEYEIYASIKIWKVD